MFHDPGARRAYILTKAVVFAFAALVTWPLARVFGPRAWWGLAVFGCALVVITALVMIGSRERQPSSEENGEDESGALTSSGAPVMLPVEDHLDLHSFSPQEIPHVVVDYLEAAHDHGFREVRLIHGRGIGVQRERVRGVLGKHPLVAEFHDAPPARGGWGATVAYLRDSHRPADPEE
jgi:hypothetical protein